MAATAVQPQIACGDQHGGVLPLLSCANRLCAALVCCLQFNAGSAGGAGYIAGQAFINTQAAAAASMLTFMLMVRTDTLQQPERALLVEKG